MIFQTGTIYSHVVEDSISPDNIRLTTFFCRLPKCLLAELNTHRAFSRNASSSRAIPSKRMRAEAWNPATRFTPMVWGINQRGMQATNELSGISLWLAKKLWGVAARTACVFSFMLEKLNLHKQTANRILEPFIHANVVVTATDFMNFFGLRLHKDAQPEMRILAECMWKAYTNSKPKKLQSGEWHLPFLTDNEKLNLLLEDKKKISVARCARTSFLSFETGKQSTPEEDIKLFNKLLGAQPLHASPAEHQATPDEFDDREPAHWCNKDLHGNFYGWIQFRKTLPGENMAPIPIEFISS